MSRENAYHLKRLPLTRKILLSLVLLLSASAYVASWASATEVAEWAVSTRELHVNTLLYLGTLARALAREAPKVFIYVVAANFIASGLLVASALFVFRHATFPRAAKRALMLATTCAFGLCIGTWLTTPYLWISEASLLTVEVVTSVLCAVLIAFPLQQMWFFRRFSAPQKKRVVIVGGGFAGLDVARRLDRKIGWSDDVEIVLVDRRNYFLFPPLLPSVAVGAIETRQVTYPFRRTFETTNVIFRKAEVLSIDAEKKRLTSRIEFDHRQDHGTLAKHSTLDWDILVLCPGAVSQTFNTPGVEEHAFFMRELGDAIAVRNHVIDCFEQAAAAVSRNRQRELLRFVVVGAGPTGIEIASEVHDLAHHVLLKRYPELSADAIEVCLVQSGTQVLPGWDAKVVEMATKQLAHLDIKLILDTRVCDVGDHHATLANGTTLRTRSVIWCAGVRAHPLLDAGGLVCADSGRACITPDLRAEGHDDIFILGDAAHLIDEATGRPFPPLGQVAFQQGAHATVNILRLLEGKPLLPFKYFDFGALVSVGEHYAAVHLLGVHLRGFLGWFVWRTLYLGKLVGVGNRIRVVLDWTLDLLFERSISQILERDVAPASDVDRDLGTEENFHVAGLYQRVQRVVETIDDAVTSKVAYTDSRVESEHGIRKRPALRAAIVLRPNDSAIEGDFEATLPSTANYSASLSRENALLGRDALATHGKEIGDEGGELGDYFVIDADERCQSLFESLEGQLLALARFDAEIHFEKSLLQVHVPRVGDDENLKAMYDALMDLWIGAADLASASHAAAKSSTVAASAA